MTNETEISKPLIEGEHHFDVAIIGGGLAGLLKADILSDTCDPKLRVAIIDPFPESLKQKTFSSWRKKAESPHRYCHLVANRWEKFRITDPHGRRIEKKFEEYCYERIPGEQLLKFLNSKLQKDPRFFRINAEVINLTEKLADPGVKPYARIELSGSQIISASAVLSSPIKNLPSVLQYFFGFEIQTNFDHFDCEMVDLMDFSIPQEGEVRFVYVLPFSKRHALVEFTVFSEKKLADQDCEAILRKYISEKLKISDFSILKTESGVIPMIEDSESLFSPSFGCSLIEVIGSAAGMIKPSTGYSFQRNLEGLNHGKLGYADFRFRIYDSLLLDLIRKKGGIVSNIFCTLFKSNSSSRVFPFLDEKSRISDELRIFFSLPWIPFLSRLLALYPFFFAVLTTLILRLTVGGLAVWIVPILGLATSGIGHGSLDHLIDSSSHNRFAFYIRYFGWTALFLGAWYFVPALALGFFIFQSADHFGESYWIRSIRNSRNDFRVRSLAWIWGLFAAVFSVLFHWGDSLPIMRLIVGRETLFDGLALGASRGLAFLLFAMATGVAFILDRYDQRATARAVNGLPATLLLGFSSMALPLLPGFFCFFAFWHGWDSVKAQKLTMGWSSAQYIRRALPFTLISLAGILALVFMYSHLTESDQVWKILFVMIGALTAAHAPVMKKFLQSP